MGPYFTSDRAFLTKYPELSVIILNNGVYIVGELIYNKAIKAGS